MSPEAVVIVSFPLAVPHLIIIIISPVWLHFKDSANWRAQCSSNTGQCRQFHHWHSLSLIWMTMTSLVCVRWPLWISIRSPFTAHPCGRDYSSKTSSHNIHWDVVRQKGNQQSHTRSHTPLDQDHHHCNSSVQCTSLPVLRTFHWITNV